MNWFASSKKKDPNYWYNKGVTIIKNPRYWHGCPIVSWDKALPHLEKATSLGLNTAEVWYLKAQALSDDGAYGNTDAFKCCNKAISLNKKFADPWILKGKMVLGKVRALGSSESRETVVYGNKKEELEAVKMYKTAATYFGNATKADPRKAKGWWYRARALIAAACPLYNVYFEYSDVANFSGDDYEAKRQIGNILQKKGELYLKEILGCFDKSIEAAKKDEDLSYSEKFERIEADKAAFLCMMGDHKGE